MAETFSLLIDARYNADERRSIGMATIEFIVKRTERGLGIGGRPFVSSDGTRSYSKAYQEHRDFVTSGKPTRPINLTLTGDMLSSIEVLDISLPGKVVIGIENEQNAEKVRWMREKGYIFLGVSNEEKNIILSVFTKLTGAQITAAIAAIALVAQTEEDEEEEGG